MGCCGVVWSILVCNGLLWSGMVFYSGLLWSVMVCHGVLWDVMVYYGL